METITDSKLTGGQEVSDQTSAEPHPTLTPVSEETPSSLPTKPKPPKPPARTRPKPLPRKSSMSSESKDLPVSVSPSQSPNINSQQPSDSKPTAAPSCQPTAPAARDQKNGYHGAMPLSTTQKVGHREENSEDTRENSTSDHQEMPSQTGASGESDQCSEGVSQAAPDSQDVVQDEDGGYPEEAVQLRRSVSAGNEPMDWEGHVFAGESCHTLLFDFIDN